MSSETLQSEIVPRRTKFIYGLGDWGTSAATAVRNLYWLFFLVSVVGLRAELAGVVILVGRIWDGINDPLVGMISDRVQTRWGRRRPFLLYGAVPFGLFFFLLFFIPPIESELWLAIYYGLVYLIFDTTFTILNVPYIALTPELTEDYDERSSLAGWRIATAILAALVASATFKIIAEDVIGEWFSQVLELSSALQAGYAVTAALAGITFIIPPLILFLVIREPKGVPIDTSPFKPWKTFKEVFSNRPFRIAAAVYLLSFSTADVVISVLLWFLIFYVRVDRGYDSLILAIVLGIGFMTMPLIVKMMRHFGKRNTYIVSMSIYAVVLLLISLAPPGGQLFVIIAAIFAGFGYGAISVIPWAMVADVVEEDELKTGKRREGVYSGYLVFFRKLATAFTIFVVTQILARTGFIGGTTGGQVFIEQPESALLALKLLVGVIPSLMLALSILIAWRYPLDRATHYAIRQELAKRRIRLEGE
ncbi:MAG: MFS transporter [Anaerolineae bacterium]|nr:MAG: MFS transporter [Anaerolineae bacterium]